MSDEELTPERVTALTAAVDIEAPPPDGEPVGLVLFGTNQASPAQIAAARYHAGTAPLVIATGGINRHNAQHALSERWNGARWSVVRVNGPHLAGVSALAANDAWAAAGSGSSAGAGRIMHWNGHLWTLATKLDSRRGLGAVAEVSPTDVWAVGGHFTP